jgi:ABC-type phosphate transport system substrate-binding protein
VRHILWATLLTCAFAASSAAQEIRASGSTAVFSLASRWGQAYQKTGGARLDYRPVGSAAGLNDIRHESSTSRSPRRR